MWCEWKSLSAKVFTQKHRSPQSPFHLLGGGASCLAPPPVLQKHKQMHWSAASSARVISLIHWWLYFFFLERQAKPIRVCSHYLNRRACGILTPAVWWWNSRRKRQKNCFLLPNTDVTILVSWSLNFLVHVCAEDLVNNVLLHLVNTQFERCCPILSNKITFRLHL